MASKGLCRYDRRCRRPDCYFDHPNGREIDEAPGGPYGGGAAGAGGAFGGREGTDGNVYYPAEDGSYPATAPLKPAGQGYGRGGGGGYRGRGGTGEGRVRE